MRRRFTPIVALACTALAMTSLAYAQDATPEFEDADQPLPEASTTNTPQPEPEPQDSDQPEPQPQPQPQPQGTVAVTPQAKDLQPSPRGPQRTSQPQPQPIEPDEPLPDQRMNRSAGLPPSVVEQRLTQPLTVSGLDVAAIDRPLLAADEPQEVIVHLSEESVAEADADTPAEQADQMQAVEAQQDSFEVRLDQLDPEATTVGRVQQVLNAVFVEADAEAIDAIADDPQVERIARVGNYQLDLTETVPYVGATAVQDSGVDGSGVTVAVLDSGIDYTHADLGGPGTDQAYTDAYGEGPTDPRSTTRDGLFPTATVVEGYDFVGEQWTGSDGAPLRPDEDPIDAEGHGTHVADIIAGASGVAPGASLLAVKTCSALSSACSGRALIQGMDYAADPNGDGLNRDRVDIINMSLGSVYGQPFDDDLAQAVEGASRLGILTVASAGNSGDKPYVTGTPAAAPSALSVAQTQVPSARLQYLKAGGRDDIPAEFQPWSVPPTDPISGEVQYGDGAGGNSDGCRAFAPGSLTGRAVLVDRGSCSFTRKISNISQAGGAIGVIGLVAPGAPFSGGDDGDRPIEIPAYMISQSDSEFLQSAVGTLLTLDPARQVPLAGQVAGSSSRGPSGYYQQIKPEIGAPGASVSAIAGSGTGTGPFGGTSGAAPMVAGSAALLLDKVSPNQRPDGQDGALRWALRPPHVLKALLMNNAEPGISSGPSSGAAEVTRVGAGEVRVDRAVAAPVAAWDLQSRQAGLSFGQHEVDGTTTLKRWVRLGNLTDAMQTYMITAEFRSPDDEATGAVSVSTPQSVTVRPLVGGLFEVRLTIDGSKIPTNSMSSGPAGADGSALSLNEIDGRLVLDNGTGHVIRIPWHVLPRQAASTSPHPASFTPVDFPAAATVGLTNRGSGVSQLDAYSLLAQSLDIPNGGPGGQSPNPDLRAVGVTTFEVAEGFCSADPSFVWAFAIDTWEDQSHLAPVRHFVNLDTNQDGRVDVTVFNGDASGPTSLTDGRQVTWALDVVTGVATSSFFTQHATNTGNTVHYVCAEQVGLSAADLLATSVDVVVEAFDFYFGGPGDIVEGLTVTPLGERYVGLPRGDLGPGESGAIEVYDFGPWPDNSPELGVMVITNGDRGAGARGGATDDTDTLYLLAE